MAGTQLEREEEMSKQILLENMSPEDLCLIDPLARLLLKLSRHNRLLVILIAVVIHTTILIGGGWWISVSYINQKFRPIYDSRELGYLVLQFVIIVPALWTFYVLEPINILQVFRELAYNNVIGKSKSKYLNLNDFLHNEIKLFNKYVNIIVIIAIVVLILVMWLIQVYTAPAGDPTYYRPWWFINPFYFWGVWFPEIIANLYMVMWISVRRFITVIIVSKLLNSFEVIPKLFHPDQSNGLSPIGNYAIKISPLVTLVGFWIFFAIIYPILYGLPLNVKYDTISYIIIYTMLIPLVLILPVWKTHLTLKSAKFQSLETIAGQIRTMLAAMDLKHFLSSRNALALEETQNSSEAKRLVEVMPAVEVLERKYRLLEKEHHVWPFNMPSLRGFIISTGSPLFWTIVSILIQKYIFP